MMRALVWLRNDLRFTDNPVLSQASKEADELILFYCFDERFYTETEWGFPRTDSYRAQFLIESLTDLQDQLGADAPALQIRYGNTLEQIQQIREHLTIDRIYCAEECTLEEMELEAELENAGFQLVKIWHYSLYHPEDLPFELNTMPKVFTPFRKKLEKYASIKSSLPKAEIPAWPKALKPSKPPGLAQLGLSAKEQDPRAVLSFKGGEREAWKRLRSYIWEGDHLRDYKKTRNGMVGADYSSKFSAWLAAGCISARSIYEEIKKYEATRVKNSSTYWLYFELMWRDFFRFTALKEKEHFFKIERGPQLGASNKFQKWCEGTTGEPFVDANMQELKRSGFMSNRGRQNVASYLVNDLGVHWYLGAAWFESQLIDYDVCSNYGNWTYVAGVGNDPRDNRYFNIPKQAERYDPEGEYQKLWASDF